MAACQLITIIIIIIIVIIINIDFRNS